MKLFRVREKKDVADIDKKKEPVEWWFGSPFLVIVFLFGFPWVTLGLMNVGLLISSEVFYDGYAQESIRCEYLVGFKIVERTQLRINEPDCSLFANLNRNPVDGN